MRPCEGSRPRSAWTNSLMSRRARSRSLSPLLRGEGRGEGCFHKHFTRGWTPSPRPSPPEEGGEGARAPIAWPGRRSRMSVKRKPVAFGDLRGWMAALEAAGELRRIDAQVDWNIELGTIARLAQGAGTGPALVFNNIKDYNGPTSRCRRLFSNALNNYRRIAMMLGLPPDTHPRELVRLGRTIMTGSLPPRIVKTGPVKENIVTGKDVDLYQLPAPYWNRLDGGRYLMTYGGVVTKDPTADVMNVGVYRGMISAKDRIPILMWRAQHIGHHVTAWQQGGKPEMPIAVAMGWEPT